MLTEAPSSAVPESGSRTPAIILSSVDFRGAIFPHDGPALLAADYQIELVVDDLVTVGLANTFELDDIVAGKKYKKCHLVSDQG